MTEPTFPSGLLLIEGDAETLERQGHRALGDDIAKMAAAAGAGLRFLRIALRSEQDVRRGQVLASLLRFRAVVLLAHAGPDGVVVAPRSGMTWRSVGESLAPLKPELLVTVACYGGGSVPALTLFDAIPTLQTIVGSPVPVTANQARMALVEAFVVAAGGDMPPEASMVLLGLNVFATNGILFRRSRGTIMRATPSELIMMDLLGLIAASSVGGGGNSLPIRG